MPNIGSIPCTESDADAVSFGSLTGNQRQAINSENEALERTKAEKADYQPEMPSNGDTGKQLLARSHSDIAHLLVDANPLCSS